MHLQNIFKIRALTRLSTLPLLLYIIYIYIYIYRCPDTGTPGWHFFRVRGLLQQLWMLAGS